MLEMCLEALHIKCDNQINENNKIIQKNIGFEKISISYNIIVRLYTGNSLKKIDSPVFCFPSKLTYLAARYCNRRYNIITN